MNKPTDSAKQPRRQRAPTPALAREITLNTLHCQRVYKRVWDRLKADIFILTIPTRTMGLDEAADQAEKFLDEQFEKIRADLAEDIERADVLMDEHALTDRASYGEAALSVTAEYTSPQANRYLDLLLAMDQLLMRIDALWLSGLVEAKQRASRGYEWQRRLIKLANRVRDLGDRARRYLQEEQAKRAAKVKPEAATDGTDAEQDGSSIEPAPTSETRSAVGAE